MRVISVVISVLVASGCAAHPQMSEQLAAPQMPAVAHASGVAVIHVPADLATVTIQFTASGRTPRAAGMAAAQRANAIRDALVAVGVPRDSIPTGGRWRWWGGGSQMSVSRDRRDTTYIRNETFTARIRNFELIGLAIDTALAVGAQTIANVQFSRTEMRGPYLEVLELATRNARENAEVMVSANGGRLGKLLDLSTQPLSTQTRPIYPSDGIPLERVALSGTASNTSTTVIAQDIRVTTTVYGRWEVWP